MPPSKRKRGAVQEGAAAAEGGRRFAVNDRVKAEFIEKVSGDEGRFWTEGTVTRVAASGAVTVAFDLDGMVEVYPRKDAATELRHVEEPRGVPKYTRQVREFTENGLCQLKHGLTRQQVRMCRQEVNKMFCASMEVIRRLDLQDDLVRGFTTFKMRHTGRYDIEIKDFDKPIFSFLREKAPWLPLVHALLGPDCVLNHTGVMLSMPGSETQPWHSDGDHLSSKKHLPVHCLNVFVPLVHLTPENGGTEMVPTTHILGHYDDKQPSTTVLAEAGQCILFDFRLRHRGLGNKSRKPRPLLYVTYCIPSFRDTMNFNKRRYLTLPRLADLPAPRATSTGRGKLVEPEASLDFGTDDSDDDGGSACAPSLSREERVAKRIRAARVKHRDLAGTGVRCNGISFYVGAPVLARDAKHGWFAAKITGLKLEATPPTARVHFNQWHKRYDFNCPLDSDRLKPCSVELLAAGVQDAVDVTQGQSISRAVKKAGCR